MERFDVIIVGCGIAGCSAGFVLASKGLKTLIIERGGEPGEKNVMGGVLYTDELKKLGIDLKDLPRERRVILEGFLFPLEDSCSFLYRMGEGDDAYTVFRSSFDRWFSKKVEERGAVIVKGVKVCDLVRKNDEWIVITDAGEAIAPFVIGADGVNSVVARKTGLRRSFAPENYILTAKEVLALPPHKIESRFNLKGEEGAVLDIVGIPYVEAGGGGFIYTNRDTVSIGAGARLSTILNRSIRFPEYLEYMKRNPAIMKLIEGAELVEYSVHMIPFGGVKSWKNVVGDGVLLIGDAMGSILPDLTGAPFAVLTGRMAGEVVSQAFKNGINRRDAMKNYYRALKREKVWRGIKRAEMISQFLKRFPDFLSGISYGINDVLKDLEEFYGTSILKILLKVMKFTFTRGKANLKGIVQTSIPIDRILDLKIGTLSFRSPEEEFIRVGEECNRCVSYSCIKVCPAGVYTRTESGLILRRERCMECGACRIVCSNIKWDYPEGGKGVVFRYG